MKKLFLLFVFAFKIIHCEVDKELIDAVEQLSLEKVKELISQGKNIGDITKVTSIAKTMTFGKAHSITTWMVDVEQDSILQVAIDHKKALLSRKRHHDSLAGSGYYTLDMIKYDDDEDLNKIQAIINYLTNLFDELKKSQNENEYEINLNTHHCF